MAQHLRASRPCGIRDEGVTKLLFDDSLESHGHGKILGADRCAHRCLDWDLAAQPATDYQADPTRLDEVEFMIHLSSRAAVGARAATNLSFPDKVSKLSFLSMPEMAVYKPDGEGPFPALVLVGS